MRPAVLLLLAISTAALADGTVPATPSPAEAGVQVEKPAGDGVHYSQGSGVFLGDGLVLTAAHVVTIDPGNRKITVLVDGWRVDGDLVFDEQTRDRDLALVKLPTALLSERRRSQARVPICERNPEPNQPVEVAAQGSVSRSSTVNTAISAQGRMTGGWTDLLGTGFHHGSSGGGVFNPRLGCLWGIIRLELSGPSVTDGSFLDLTSFVPATEISIFLKDYDRRSK